MTNTEERRRDTNEKMIALVRELRTAVLAEKPPEDPGFSQDNIRDAMNAVLRDSAISDEHIACFLAVFVGEWFSRYGGDPCLRVLAGGQPHQTIVKAGGNANG